MTFPISPSDDRVRFIVHRALVIDSSANMSKKVFPLKEYCMMLILRKHSHGNDMRDRRSG